MTATDGDPNRDREADRLRETYRGYAANRRKQRSWSSANRGNIAIRDELLAAILELAEEPLRGGGEILDVGCGSGWLLAELASRGIDPGRLHGVDLIGPRVADASQRLPGADIRLADARRLPYGDGEFELVTALTCLSSMPSEDSVRAALEEAGRVLSPTGLFISYEPRFANPLNRETRHVSAAALREALGAPVAARTLTGFPPVARHLGRATPGLYAWLTRVAPTHRLSALRRR